MADLLTQKERWRIWEKCLNKPMGSYARERDEALIRKYVFKSRV